MRKRIKHENENRTELKRNRKLKLLRTLGVWTLVSLILQFGFYYVFNQAVAKVMTPTSNQKTITATYESVLPDTSPENIQISYAKDYLAYMSNGTFKVFNLKQNKVVFTKSRESGSDASMGVLNYHWLPDRNTLIYFFAKKNPKSNTTAAAPQTTTPKSPQQQLEDPNAAKSPAVTKDPAAAKEAAGTAQGKAKETQTYQPQITELHSLELPNSSEDTKPDERQNMTVSDFPAGGKITRIASSTYTNMIYLLVQSGTSVKLIQIDIMQDITVLQRADETIMNITASDRNGTLYFESKTAKGKQILAIDSGIKRKTVSSDNDYYILGDRAGNFYVGEIKNNRLVQVLTCKDSSEKDRQIELYPTWKGDIPYSKGQIGIDSSGKITIFENNTAYIITGGELKTKKISGQENYLSDDGAVYIQLTHQNGGTKVNVKPL
ncbi:MAG: hypothetical protein GX434_16215 [Peptococcaceae bacterium]|nr:hypothetical protein [Peptococcaceae bacterium]